MSKVIPITGTHTTLHSMLAEAMADPKAVQGIVIWFDENGVMDAGVVNTTRATICMGAAWLNLKAMQSMEEVE